MTNYTSGHISAWGTCNTGSTTTTFCCVLQLSTNPVDDVTAIGTSGVDILSFRAGTTFLEGPLDRVEMEGLGGNDDLHGSDELPENGYLEQLRGGNDNDRIWGYNGDDFIEAGEGADDVWGGEGNDTIDGGPGFDILYGDNGILVTSPPGDDIIYGGTGYDSIHGEMGDDQLYAGSDTSGSDMSGGPGVDRLYGSNGRDVMDGGSETDYLYGYAGDDDLFGQGGDDELYGGNGIDSIWGGPNNDILVGGNGVDDLHGEGGNDILWGGYGNDTLEGGPNADTLCETEFDLDGNPATSAVNTLIGGTASSPNYFGDGIDRAWVLYDSSGTTPAHGGEQDVTTVNDAWDSSDVLMSGLSPLGPSASMFAECQDAFAL